MPRDQRETPESVMRGIFWTIGSLPELAHITGHERRRLLRRHVGLRTCVRLVGQSLLIGFACAVIPAAATGQWIVGAAIVVTGGLGWYVLTIQRIRISLRATIVDGLAGSNVPACFECGYDLRKARGTTCPECGANIRAGPVTRSHDSSRAG
jgi:hypothetical protein